MNSLKNYIYIVLVIFHCDELVDSIKLLCNIKLNIMRSILRSFISCTFIIVLFRHLGSQYITFGTEENNPNLKLLSGK